VKCVVLPSAKKKSRVQGGRASCDVGKRLRRGEGDAHGKKMLASKAVIMVHKDVYQIMK
jgi:hypothetical protein